MTSHIMWTMNNPSLDPGEIIEKLEPWSYFRYVVFQLEEGDNGTPHYQGYLELTRSVKYKTFMNRLGVDFHCEARKGTRDQARAYCMKEKTRISGPFEAGVWKVSQQGKRTDLDSAAEVVKLEGLDAVAKKHPTVFIKYHTGLKALKFQLMPKIRSTPPEVMLYYGPTGTGKTRKAYEDNPSAYIKCANTKWFDGYEGEDTVILDDFAGKASRMDLTYLLQLLDRYPFQVEVKFGYSRLLATKIILTTNIHPKKWYDYSERHEHYLALARRFTRVYWFNGLDPIRLETDSFFNDWFDGCAEQLYFKPYPEEEAQVTPWQALIDVVDLTA